MPWSLVSPVVNYRVRSLCFKPYPNHPKGCPNYKECSRCPPQAPLVRDVLDLERPVWAIYNAFDIGAHIASMKLKHPSWSDRQLRNCLYWQPGARKSLRAEIRAFLKEHQGMIVADTPEAMGVDVSATMASCGIFLEWPPSSLAHQVVLAGSPAREAVRSTKEKDHGCDEG